MPSTQRIGVAAGPVARAGRAASLERTAPAGKSRVTWIGLVGVVDLLREEALVVFLERKREGVMGKPD
jgi:hypothetical protein